MKMITKTLKKIIFNLLFKKDENFLDRFYLLHTKIDKTFSWGDDEKCIPYDDSTLIGRLYRWCKS